MAQSKRWFRYTDDGGQAYAIIRDESNTELVNTTEDSQANVTGLDPLPKGREARYVMLSSADNLTKKKCTILTLSRYASLSTGDAFTLTANGNFGVPADTPVNIRLKQPQIERRQPFTGDTGHLDGDNP
jgi:hypothetical protein